MSTLFVDSSALLKRYRKEAGTERVSELLEGSDRLVIARLALVEVSSALVRRARTTGVPAGELQTAIAELDDEVAESFDIVELDELVMDRAVAMARQYALRGADAIQLACALLIHEQIQQSEFLLLSSDTELNAAALAAGIKVENPTA